jgi:O-6-methylguanine DNA methyltransferase
MTTTRPTPTAPHWRSVPTPAGALLVFADDNGVTTQWAALHRNGALPTTGKHDRRLLPALAAWIRAALREPVGATPVGVPEGPPFYRACWKACRRIKPGRSRTYGQLAASAGRPTAIRAAGGAMKANPQPLLTPCHRVLGIGGLGGFHGTTKRGTALALKAKLLSIEALLSR